MSTKQEIDAERVALAKERLKIQKAQNRTATIKAAVGAATALVGAGMGLYAIKKKMDLQDKKMDTTLALQELKDRAARELLERKAEMRERAALAMFDRRAENRVSSYTRPMSQLSPNLLSLLAAPVATLTEWVAPKATQKYQEAKYNYAKREAGYAENLKTDKVNFQKENAGSYLLGNLNDAKEVAMHFTTSDPGSQIAPQFPSQVYRNMLGQGDPNQPIGPWRESKRGDWGKPAKEYFGDVPPTKKRYSSDVLSKFAHPDARDPAFTVKYKVTKDAGGDWINAERQIDPSKLNRFVGNIPGYVRTAYDAYSFVAPMLGNYNAQG